jgi:molybdenum-dependent DNA-binding transcriptional regulator ModE
MAATIGNTVSYAAASATTTHSANLTLGSNSRRKVVVGVTCETSTTLNAITVNGTSVLGNDRSAAPDQNPNDTLLKMWWFDYDVPSGTPSGAITITVTSAASDLGWSFHAWEVLDAADGAPESTNVAHAASGSNATASVTASTGAALVAAGLIHAATSTIAFSGDVVERTENNESNFTSACADAANVASGTRTVTLTPSASARNSVRLLSYAAYSAPTSALFRSYFITG